MEENVKKDNPAKYMEADSVQKLSRLISELLPDGPVNIIFNDEEEGDTDEGT
ncbi:MAG: hypothetical protein IJ619_06445 [Eubacterium sp.]|nr:hypothetical protein [Eubacterium sp.]